MKVELFYTPGCKECADAKGELRATAEKLVSDLVWRELNVLDELDYAVEVGVLTLPSIAIDGEVIFSSLPTSRQLRRELTRRIGAGCLTMDPEALRQAAEQAGLLALGAAFLAGLVFSFNPVALASIPVSLAYVTKARSARQSVLFGTAFTAGMILVQVLLGFVAGLGGSWAASLVGRQWGLVLGPVLILLGLMWPGWVRLPWPSFRLRAKRPNTSLGAFALGIVFAVAVCPVCTPALVILLGAAAGIASPAFGAVMLLAFAVGRAIPIGLGAWAAGWLENLSVFAKYQKGFEIAGAATLVASGLYMLNAYYFWIPSLAI